eukprot:TRINITY_DN3204_c0_g1_i9.p1 TRINITY_DN3204_c0_g1~~TRINITY_DN3204_c0_g1_i9.p1  ORF type:complete len:334 (+),score=53.21 TRINITY_DN3204_c0_g1_i9:66-1004(+)
MPHGLGHLMGLDVHDTTIYPKVPLVENMVITMEPGLYFNKFLVERAVEDKEAVVSTQSTGGNEHLKMESTIIDADLKKRLVVKNRSSLVHKLEEQGVVQCLVFFKGEEEKFRNADTELCFRQDSTFLYFSGVEDIQGCCLVLKIEVGSFQSLLFVPDADESYPVWHGTPLPLESLRDSLGLSEVSYMTELKNVLTSYNHTVYALSTSYSVLESRVTDERAKQLKEIISHMRSVKTDEEIKIITETCRLSSEAHVELMKNCKPGLREFQLASLFHYYTSWRGCFHDAYLTIVGSGKNSAILHYNRNSEIIKGW